MKSKRATGEQGSVRAIERAADILFCFTDELPVLNLRVLQTATGLSRPTLYRLLRALERKGLVYSFGNPQRFQLGYGIAKLASTWGRNPTLVPVALPTLEALWRTTQETVALLIPLTTSLRMCVAELKGPQPISFSRGTGYTEPLYRGASGKVMLAHLPQDKLKDALGDMDLQGRQRLLADLHEIRALGVWVTYGEVISGTVAVAAPILNEFDNAVGSICVFGTESRMRGDSLSTCKEAVRRAAVEMEHLLKKRE